MIAGRHLQIVADVGVADLKAEFGITPAIEEQFALAAHSIQGAIDQVDKTMQMAEPDSDVDLRCSQAIEELQGVLWLVEWKPSKS